ncbi:31913_t:CDS:2 [Gigaspora margarita]|uniref:31913_t:CDS:1 n=1 Tax=Gigaspora margarita TaxID=4874 RepID=A0ABN7UPR4_GIGMA|nr:31913_t:CDS:2 [Gigaspora margarita]
MGEEIYWENSKDTRYAYSKLTSNKLLLEFDYPEEVLNLSTNRWIKKNGKLYQKLIREGYKYTKDLTHYLKDISPIDLDEYGTIYPLADFYRSALILPLSILARREDICRRCPITISSVVEG